MAETQVAPISNRMKDIIQTLLPAAAAAAADHAEPDPELVNLSVADNQLIRSELLEICKSAIAKDLTQETFNYPKGLGGDPSLMQALSSFFNTYFDPSIPVTPDHLVVTAGAGFGLDALASSICEPGDSILVPGPCWSLYPYLLFAKLLVPVYPAPYYTALTSHTLIPALDAAYDSAANPKRIKGLIICNPHNPFGRCYSKSALQAVLKWCSQKGLHYISDEVYGGIQFGDTQSDKFVSALSLLDDNSDSDDGTAFDKSKLHVLWSASKLFGLPGIRLGCVITQANPMVRVGSIISTYNQNPSLSALLLTHLLNSAELPTLLSKNNELLAKSYDLLSSTLTRLGIEFLPANAGFVVFAKFINNTRSWKNEATLVQGLKQYKVIVSAGKGFGGAEEEKGWVRITLAVPWEQFREGVRRIENFFLQSGLA
ncbi:putative 1-aminocyclopropane-1-carboxylate synthase protein [Botrytis fragariae]|uniref:Putative 1-aminocyclopropane-1-carboxylate synthase protein n=1 Tax=Botrytis fragariae TaxID=1964551 RepID=A0A8H6EF86_9HELO|nr:putative 1-aminocyclopropane-1-carboxylate synthase protein [Botrytis fragariae]KAF5870194.1 putative 1-aminocyclopropane-1-carboxylate synthase protein [Botrytis fragariae]